MADHVQKSLERMVPEFEEMQTSGLFTEARNFHLFHVFLPCMILT